VRAQALAEAYDDCEGAAYDSCEDVL
jgi:hypothetical protein